MIYDKDGNSLTAVYDQPGTSLDVAYDSAGNEIFRAGGGGGGGGPTGIDLYRNYTITRMSYVAPSGLQGFDYWNGILALANPGNGSDSMRFIYADTGATAHSTITPTIGHGNCLCFSEEFYDESDDFPLLCIPYSPGISYYRISNDMSAVERVRAYKLQPTIYASSSRSAIGLDGDDLYVLGYTSGSYQPGGSNHLILSKYDLRHPIDNGDGSYTLPRVSSVERAWFECVQGSQIHDGFFWVTSGIHNPAHIYALDLDTAEILLDIAPSAGEWDLEIEGCAWENDYTLIVGLRGNNTNYGMYKVTFPDKIPENST